MGVYLNPGNSAVNLTRIYSRASMAALSGRTV